MNEIQKEFRRVYFVGVGGIGMSALARYFRHEGLAVAGYDRTPSPLTRQLEAEGIAVHYADDVDLIPAEFRNKKDTLVVWTPAIPDYHAELNWFRARGFEPVKRSAMLGLVSRGKRVLAVAGTHGKTTTTTMTAWFDHVAGRDGSAFLGGISKNFDSNLVLGPGPTLAVEADEFDRSFLQLHPDAAVVTATDADHLDIYGTHEAVRAAFADFVAQIRPGGTLILKKGVELAIRNTELTVYSYACDDPEADFHAANIRPLAGGHSLFDLVLPDRTVADCRTGIPGWINIENAVAAAALIWCGGGFEDAKIRQAIATFAGVRRRFDFYINTPRLVYMDDYAHHPEELRAALTSLRGMFPGRRITAVFQPHLYTRTRDFAPEFAAALSIADNVWLLPIYPAREEPIEGIDSALIHKDLTNSGARRLIHRDELSAAIEGAPLDVLVTFGAGDIDRFCEPIAAALQKN